MGFIWDIYGRFYFFQGVSVDTCRITSIYIYIIVVTNVEPVFFVRVASMVLAHWARGAVVDPHDQILSQGVMINLHPNHEQKG